ncbi:hypothetical protein SAMN05892877_117112 [Rhizobium subbaraonis]|uniref:Uncharacterized protein n=1 Tax=Rhizobium subbaraonis TaxID=908946 RepID=A0A285UVB1_9HYPH|nr:hypothetical protein [Rhizobium subbaraonis]SOC45723.1 hypothetical protein SAMN05892877_117112 [Rhizobium subbaraonis]
MTAQSIGALAEKFVVNRWAWWQNALKGNFGPMHEGQPEQGYYRTRFKGGQWEPVAIYYPEGSDQIVAYRNGKEVDPGEAWNFCRTNPITYDAYVKAMDGKGFDDEPALATIGDNSGSDDPFDQIAQELAGEKEMAEEFLRSEIKTQADADKAGIWSKRLSDLAKRADNHRIVEKEPHLAASKAVDDKWRGPVGEAKDLSVALKRHIEPFLIAKKREEEARARKAAEEAAALRRKAEEEARAAQQYNVDPQEAEKKRAELLRQAQEAEKAAEVRNAQAGRTGAKVSVRTDKIGVVTDYGKAAAALVAMRHKDLIEIIDKLAQRAAKAGMPFDGMEVREEEKVV